MAATETRPERHAGEQRPIVEQRVGRTAAAFLQVHEIEVTEDPVDREHERQPEIVRVELLHGLGTDRVDHVGHQRRRGDDRDHLVEQVRAVFLENRPVPGRAVRQQHQLVPALAQRQEQRPQHRQDEQPVADRDVDRDRAGDGAQHEADGNRQHVDDDHVFQRAGIDDEQREVGQRDQREGRPEEVGRAERAPPRQHQRRRRCASRRRHGARRDRPMALERVQPILLAIGDVVDEIHDARQARRRWRRPPSVCAIAWGSRNAGAVPRWPKQQRGEDDQVLRPLRRAQGHEEAERGERSVASFSSRCLARGRVFRDG